MPNSVTPWIAVFQTSLSLTISQNLLKFMSIESLMLSNHLLCCPLLLLPSIFPCIRVFPHFLHQFAKCWNFNISHSNKYSGLISFRVDWLDPLAVQGTPKSLPQYHSSKESIIWHSAFFKVQSSHLYMTTGKLGLTRWTFVSKVMSVFFNALCLSEVPHPHPKEQVSYNFMT